MNEQRLVSCGPNYLSPSNLTVVDEFVYLLEALLLFITWQLYETLYSVL